MWEAYLAVVRGGVVGGCCLFEGYSEFLVVFWYFECDECSELSDGEVDWFLGLLLVGSVLLAVVVLIRRIAMCDDMFDRSEALEIYIRDHVSRRPLQNCPQ